MSLTEEIIQLNQTLLNAIVAGDYETYSSLCSTDLTCFEEETEGHLVSGLKFHKFYFDLHRDGSASSTVVTMANPNVRWVGGASDVAVVCYTRLNQSGTVTPKLTKACETRIWEKNQEGNWKCVHVHRS